MTHLSARARSARGHLLNTPLATALTLGILSASSSAQAQVTQLQKLAPPNLHFLSSMGRAVALDGTRALVTAHAQDDVGAAYAYSNVGGVWGQTQKLVHSDAAMGDSFGFDVVIDGDFAVVGAPNADPLAPGSGAAYAFFRTGGQWIETEKLTPIDGGDQADNFGQALAAADEWLFVAQKGDDDMGTNAGAVYVYRRSFGSYSFREKLYGSNATAGDSFGWAVATDGEVLVVSAIEDDDLGADSGSVYVFRYDGVSWVEEQHLHGSDSTSEDWFGWSVAVDGDVLAAGAVNQDTPLNQGGAVYTFRFDGAVWAEEQKLQHTTLEEFDRVGWSLAVEGDRLVTGAAGWGAGFAGDGALFSYHHDGTQWVEVFTGTRSDNGDPGMFGANLGLSLDMQGQTVIGGAPWAGVPGVPDAGAAYVFSFGELGLDAVPDTLTVPAVLNLETSGGLAGTPMGLLLVSVGATPLNLVLGFDVFAPNGKTTFALPLSPSVAGATARFLTGGFWKPGAGIELSNLVEVTFQ